MNITQLFGASAANSLTSSQTTSGATGVSPVELALRRADLRIQTAVDASTAQLSSYGLLKSAVSNVQLAAHALHNLPAAVSDADVKTVASGFATVFNNALSTAKTTTNALGAGSVGNSATRAAWDLRRAVSANSSTFDALKKIGFSTQADGSLALDAKKLDAALKADPAAVRASLAKIGQQVDTVATRELATDGTVGVSLASLTQKSAALKGQQAALAKIEQTAATAAATQVSTGSGFAGYAMAAYQSAY
jgi:flagellar capping protein FliD